MMFKMYITLWKCKKSFFFQKEIKNKIFINATFLKPMVKNTRKF